MEDKNFIQCKNCGASRVISQKKCDYCGTYFSFVNETPNNKELLSTYLRNIGKFPLLTPAEEIELGNQVHKMMKLTEDGQLNENNKEFTLQQKLIIKTGILSKERMMKSNLRLVVSLAKKYQGKGLELLDLIQEGSLGLERAVEKFDPTRGYRFSTYAFWWIRQSMTRAIACQSLAERVPGNLSEKLATIKKVRSELFHKLGKMPSRIEIAEAMNIGVEDLDSILRQVLSTSNQDHQVNGDERGADTNHEEQLGKWLNHLGEQEKLVLRLRFGLDGNDRLTRGEVGRSLAISAQRVKEVELKALRKINNLRRGGKSKRGGKSSCSNCGGSGEVKRMTRTPFGDFTQIVKCPSCSNDKSSKNNLEKLGKSPEECSGEELMELIDSFFEGLP